MKKSNPIILLLMMAIVASAIVFFFMRRNTEQVTVLPDNVITDLKSKNKAIQWDNYVPYIIEDDYKPLAPSTSLADVTGKNITLASAGDHKYKLVIRYSYLDCDLCLDMIMKQLKIVSSEQSIENVIALTTMRSQRDFTIHAGEKNFPVKLYNVNGASLGLFMENKSFPFIFVLTPDLRAVKIFTPSRDDPYQIAYYFKKTIKFVNTMNHHVQK